MAETQTAAAESAEQQTQHRASIEELLKAGTHFGHLTSRWNPKMRSYIFMERNNIHIIDLMQTQVMLDEAAEAAARFARQGKTIMFVGTKKQARDIVRKQAEACGSPYTVERWLGGTLTNFQTIRRSIRRMEELKRMDEDGTFDQLKKKEKLMRTREREKLERVLGGIADMPRLPGALFIVDINREHIAVDEARKLGIPIISIVDTNCDPDLVDYPIPANDDALKSIELITTVISDAINEGRKVREVQESEDAAEKQRRAQERKDSAQSSEKPRRQRRARTTEEPVENVEAKDVEDEDTSDTAQGTEKAALKSVETSSAEAENTSEAAADEAPDADSAA